MAFFLIYVTHPDEPTARKISDQLLAERHIACSNIFPAASSFWWKNEIAHDAEFVSILKTTIENWAAVERRVLEMHPYEIPCLVKMEVSANAAYENWILESVATV